MAGHGTSLGPLIAAFLGNLAITILKGIAAFFTASPAMLAETVHSFADTSNQVLLYVGLKRGKRAADEAHPLGYGKETYFWAFLVSIIIFAGGAVFSIYEGTHRLLDPVENDASRAWAYGVLSGAIFFEGIAFTIAWKELKRVAGDRGVWWAIRESREPILFTVVLEDAAAMLGLVIALIGVALADYTGIQAFDAATSIVIGVLLAIIAFILAREVHSLLLGESAHPDLRQKILATIQDSSEVEKIVDFKTIQMGPESVYVMVEAKMTACEDLAAAIHAVEGRVAALDTTIKQVYFEPEPGGAEEADPGE